MIPNARSLLAAALLTSVHGSPADPPVEVAASRRESGFWLENMLVHHGYTVAEAAGVLGWPETEVVEKSRLLQLGQPAGSSARPTDSRVRILPYPGGRHPRIGFLEGAIDPQRGTKVSLFPPWAGGGYVVLDLPEAIFSNLGLTFLAHTHIPTVWTQQNRTITNVDWVREPDGRLRSEWRLPNGIRFGADVLPHDQGADLRLWLRNGTPATLTGLRTQVCLMLKGAPGFQDQNQDRKEYAKPLAIARADGSNRYILMAFERCGRAWGNEKCPCLHSDPVFPDTPSGGQAEVRGRLRFYEGGDVLGEKERMLSGIDSRTP